MDVVEIRVRGVGGETAIEILEGPVRQVDGDADAGFYKADRAEGSDVDHSVEAYEWGLSRRVPPGLRCGGSCSPSACSTSPGGCSGRPPKVMNLDAVRCGGRG